MKFRIKVEELSNGKFKHKYNLMVESSSVKKIISKINNALEEEYELRMELLAEWINERSVSGVKKILRDTDKDKLSVQFRGKDISEAEYLENEIYFEVRQ